MEIEIIKYENKSILKYFSKKHIILPCGDTKL